MIEMALLFWIATPIFIIILMAASEHEAGFEGLILIGVYIVFVLYWSLDISIFSIVNEHPLRTLLTATAYILFGVAWSIFKFIQLIKTRLNYYNMQKLEFIKRNKLSMTVNDVIPDEFKENLRKWCDYNKPNPMECKNKLFTWVVLWPFSMLVFLFNDIIKDTANAIYRALSNTLTRIVNYYFAIADKDRS